MSDMIAYNVLFGGRIYPTGKCKKKTIAYNDNRSVTIEYIQCRAYILGIPLWNRWVNKRNVEWRSEKEEIYDCKT